MIRNLERIDYSKEFLKQLKKAPYEIKIAFTKRLKLFIDNPFSSQLNNHLLTGKYSGYRSININGDWRAVYSVSIDKQGNQIIIFELLGTHSQLYK